MIWGDVKDVKQLAPTLQESQAVELSNAVALDVARMWRIYPAELLHAAIGRPAPPKSAELWADIFLRFSLLHRMRRIERGISADRDLFPDARNRRYARFDIEELLRGDIATIAMMIHHLVQVGVLNPNEGRAMIGKGPRPAARSSSRRRSARKRTATTPTRRRRHRPAGRVRLGGHLSLEQDHRPGRPGGAQRLQAQIRSLGLAPTRRRDRRRRDRRRRRAAAELGRSAGVVEARHALVQFRDVEFRDATGTGDGSYTLTGYAAVYEQETVLYDGSWWRLREVIAPGAFDAVLGRTRRSSEHRPRHDARDRAAPASTASAASSSPPTSEGLRVFARLDPADPDVVSLAAKMNRGIVDQMSFAFTIARAKYESEIDEENDFEDELRTILEIGELYDTAVCAQGAYSQTSAELAMRSFTTALGRAGVDLAGLLEHRDLESGASPPSRHRRRRPRRAGGARCGADDAASRGARGGRQTSGPARPTAMRHAHRSRRLTLGSEEKPDMPELTGGDSEAEGCPRTPRRGPRAAQGGRRGVRERPEDAPPTSSSTRARLRRGRRGSTAPGRGRPARADPPRPAGDRGPGPIRVVREPLTYARENSERVLVPARPRPARVRPGQGSRAAPASGSRRTAARPTSS
jgi:HK97 family phage prohead protease